MNFVGLHKSTSTLSTVPLQSCPKFDTQKLNVHLVPHTHDDLGWLKTVDQYFFGSKLIYFHLLVQFFKNRVLFNS